MADLDPRLEAAIDAAYADGSIFSESSRDKPRVLIVTEEDYGQREAANIYYCAYFLIPEGMSDEEARAALRSGRPGPREMVPFYAVVNTFEEPD